MDVREKLVELLYECVSKNMKQRIIGEKLIIEIAHGDIANHLIAHGVTVQEWISVKDRLPDKNREVVLIALRWEETDIGWYDKDDKCWQSEFINSYEDGDVTHWQLLPQPPKGE